MIRAPQDRWFDHFRRTGDPRVLAKVFDRTAPELWRVAAHLCRDRHAAEDAVQGTFLAAIEDQDGWDATRPLLPWLLGMLANRVREHRRLAARVVDAQCVTRTGERDPAELAEHGEFGAAFRAALQRVAEPYRSAIERHLVFDKAAHEIADELGVPAGTVRMRLHRGLEQLRQKLPQGFVGGGAVALRLPPESLAAMREVVLAKVPGGAAVTASSGAVVGVTGALLMKKTMLAVVASVLVALGLWASWPAFGNPAASAPSAVAGGVAASARPGEDAVVASATGEAPRVEAERTAADAATGQLRVVLRNRANGEPVAGVPLEVVAGIAGEFVEVFRTVSAANDTSSNGLRRVLTAVTDAEGAAIFELPAGRASITARTLPLREPIVAEVVAGRVTEHVVEVPPQLWADVLVVDEGGRLVAGARIVGSSLDLLGAIDDRELGRTGEDGRWRASFVDSTITVRAFHEGHAASRAVRVFLFEQTQPVTLRLGGAPAALYGTVRDADGLPLADARVTIKTGSDSGTPLLVRTDALGRYECACVPAGPCTVVASQEVRGQLRSTSAAAEAIAYKATVVDLRFDRGARLVVRLQRSNGEPWANRIVSVTPKERSIRARMDLGRRGFTDKHGQCTFDGLMPGAWEVWAMVENDECREVVDLAEGQVLEFARVLGGPAWIEVLAVDELRRPLTGWTVKLRSDGEGGRSKVLRAGVDEAGLARFAGLPARAFRASLHKVESSLSSLACEVATNARTELVVPRAQMPEATVRGKLAAAEVFAFADARVTLVRGSGSIMERRSPNDQLMGDVDPVSGSFAFAGLPAGAYVLLVQVRHEVAAWRYGIEVPGGGDVDLGLVDVGRATLRFRVVRADGEPVRGLFVSLDPGRGRPFVVRYEVAEDGVVTLANVPSGNHDALVWGENIAPVIAPLTVRAGQDTETPIVAAAAVPTTFRFVDVPPGMKSGQLTVRQVGSELVAEQAGVTKPYVRGLVPGSYRVEFDSLPGYEAVHGAADFTVGSAPGQPIEVRVAK